ncbi:MAG TPA: aspartate-semialdehyde dehydrogenase [Candidatus Nanoarchaeia archaeon]|nr:aspartate-semialdehyde dehydrogenase [Candidatus Nanoarchaeia archaeon]
MSKLKVGVLGATGMVGQNYIRLLENHPWFEVSYVAASPKSAGKSYKEALAGRWAMQTPIPRSIENLIVHDVSKVEEANEVSFVFSAVEMEKDEIRDIENQYAAAGIPVVSNNSAHRWTDNVPMLIPEINHEHINIIPEQQKAHGWEKGFVAVKPNCSVQSYLTPIYALLKAGYAIDKMIITTMQAISGAGKTFDTMPEIIDNVIPYIGGEEEKSEKEPLKILGRIEKGRIKNNDTITISAHCNRVPVTDGHMACVSVNFKGNIPTVDEIKRIWKEFKSVPQELDLPFSPQQPIIYEEEDNRPQTKLDRNNDKAMAVTVGRLRPCNIFDIRFVGLSHNTVRGAAGGGILNAELLYKKGYIK